MFVTLALLAFGLVVLSSASTVESLQNFNNTYRYIVHQILVGVGLGLASMFVCSKIDYHFWQKILPALILISLAALAAVKLSAFGVKAGGASRWLALGPIIFQPSELAKLVIIIYLASWIDKRRGNINDFYYGLLPSLCIVGLFALLILWQPDFGTMFVLLGIAAFMLFAAGISLKYFFWTSVATTLGLLTLAKSAVYRSQRLAAFFNPDIDPKGISYHINQALLALGSGGLWGYGYGLSRQKHNYLPEVMSDSIFAVLGEELGFAGVIFAICLFLFFAHKGFLAAKGAPDNFGKLLAFGITFWIIFQALVNIAAMAGLIPLTGVPLPFFSYGSTALILNLAAAGILLNISRFASVK